MTALASVVTTLVAALLPDPFYQAITVEHAGQVAKSRILQRYFEYSLLEAQRTGRCVIAPAPEYGAAVWLLPRDEETAVRESEDKLAFMSHLLGPAGFRNYRQILAFMSPLAERHVSASDWYLSILGVHPSMQGKGVGQELLAVTLREADAAQAACYLETFIPRNVGFYSRLGFEPVAHCEEPTTLSTYWLMRRVSR